MKMPRDPVGMTRRPPNLEIELGVGETLADLEISGAWVVDPARGRVGLGDVVVEDGILVAVRWREGETPPGTPSSDEVPVVVAPGFVDLHVHLREPGNEDAETVATGLAAAAHGGFTAVCAMGNTDPPSDDPAVVARVREAARRSGSPVNLLPYGTVSRGRAGELLAPLGELADAGVVGFSDDGAPVRSAGLLRQALLYAGMVGLPVVDHPEEASLTEGAEAHEGLVATILGLRGWPAAAEVAAVARDLAVLEEALRDEPRARLHLTHLSTARSIDLVRQAKAAGLPVTCDVTPHHLALTDRWLLGDRRWAWEVAPGEPVFQPAAFAADGKRYDPHCRVNPPLRPPADALACLAGLADGTVDAVATDHAPHRRVDKEVEFGLAAPGLSGLETALGILLEAVEAGRIDLLRAITVLTTGPAGVLGGRLGRPAGLEEGEAANLVVFDRRASWLVNPESLQSKGKNTPLLGRQLPGRILLTVAGGRIAHADLPAA